jgi:hypothetical protein
LTRKLSVSCAFSVRPLLQVVCIANKEPPDAGCGSRSLRCPWMCVSRLPGKEM